MKDLREITGQEAGIVIFDNGDVIIANFEAAGGYIPRIDPLGITLISLPCELEVAEVTDIDDIGKLVDIEKVLYDAHDVAGEILGRSGKVYTILANGTPYTVIVPDGWN